VFHNIVAENESFNNGLAVAGAGAGVGIFDSVPEAQAYGNLVINNRITGNGLPGHQCKGILLSSMRARRYHIRIPKQRGEDQI
jgi:hypothetical protein